MNDLMEQSHEAREDPMEMLILERHVSIRSCQVMKGTYFLEVVTEEDNEVLGDNNVHPRDQMPQEPKPYKVGGMMC